MPHLPLTMYRELPPPPELARYLACFWVHAVPPEQEPQQHRVLPDGCVDIISGLRAEPTVVGPMTRHGIAELAPGMAIVGARFKPGMAPALLRCASSLLLNHEPDAAAVLPRGGRTHLAGLGDGGVRQRLSSLRKFLVERLDDAEPDWLAAASAEALHNQPDRSIADLSATLGLSERQLLRRFEAAVGYPPSMFRRVVRLQRLARLPDDARRSLRLVRLAADAGYSDQAHMNRDVRQLAGLTPKALLAA